MKKIFLVDVSAMFFRAFFAIRPLSNSKGLPTNALYGFLSMTVKLLRDVQPDYMAFCFDRPEPSFRVELDPRYKANRSEMPEELAPQIPYIRKLSDALGIPCYSVKGYEADDLIGSFTRWGREQGLDVTIVSGDKDFGQMIGPHVQMYDTMKDVKYDVDGVIEKWGVHPDQFIDYLALIGDSSDNIPGVKGVGPKTAQKLLAEFKTLDGIYENIDSIKSKSVVKKLTENKDEAYLSKKLVTIVTDMDMEYKLDELKLKPIDESEVKELLGELEFKTFEKKLFGDSGRRTRRRSTPPGEAPQATENDGHSTGSSFQSKIVVTTEEKVDVSQLKKQIKPNTEIWGMVNERGIYLGQAEKVMVIQGEPSEIGRQLEGLKLKWKGFDLKEVWKACHIIDPVPAADLMLAAYVIRPGAIKDFSEIYKKYVGDGLPELPSAKQIYECHLRLELALDDKLSRQEGTKVYQELELPLIPVLLGMEKLGIKVETKELKKQSQSLEKDIEKLEKSIHDQAGESFNIASPKQLSHILFDVMKMPPQKKTKTGYSTNTDVLEKLAPDYPICNELIKFRELTKLKSTYVDALPLLVHQEDGRIHTQFNQALTTTGRLSSSQPNLQNIPIRTERGALIRNAFVADKGKSLVSADYSQIELRILAHITGDKGLCEAFANDRDIHQATASEIYDVKLEDVTPDLRRHAKAVNFGIAYGQGAFGLAETLDISQQEASEIIQQYFTKFPKVHEYMTEIVEKAKSQGYVSTLFGRRRYIDELKSRNGNIRKFGERAAINAPIQGTASDIVKKCMIDIYKAGKYKMLLQVHDELIFEVDIEESETAQKEIKKVMEKTVSLNVPLKVNVAVGKDWGEAHA